MQYQDHVCGRGEKYENPIPSRELILTVIRDHNKPMSRDLFCKHWQLPIQSSRRECAAVASNGK